MELAVDRQTYIPLNLAILDPLTARFRLVDSEEAGGQYQQLEQQQRWGSVPVNRETTHYAGIGTYPTKPIGRPIVTPSIYANAFLLLVIQDIRQVIAHQGYPRYHYKIDVEELTKLINSLHPNLIGNDAKIAEFIRTHQSEIKSQLENLEPTSDFIGLSTIDISLPRGSSSGFNLQGVEGYIKLLERSITRGLRSTLLLMGIVDSATEANAGRQLEHYVSGIESLQETLSTLLSKVYTHVCLLGGDQAVATFRFNKQRISDKKVLAETESLAIDNIIKKLNARLITHDQAIRDIEGLRIPFYLGESNDK